MSQEGYSYTVISVHPGEQPQIDVSLRTDDRVTIYAPRPDAVGAYLSLMFADVTVGITPAEPTAPTAEDIQVARRLVDAFTDYLAAVERLHAESGSASDDPPAGVPAA